MILNNLINENKKSINDIRKDISNLREDMINQFEKLNINNKNNINNNNFDFKKYKIGEKRTVNKHEHELIYTDYKGKCLEYSKNVWFCNICLKIFQKDIPNFHCKTCHYDICDKCFEKIKK